MIIKRNNKKVMDLYTRPRQAGLQTALFGWIITIHFSWDLSRVYCWHRGLRVLFTRASEWEAYMTFPWQEFIGSDGAK